MGREHRVSSRSASKKGIHAPREGLPATAIWQGKGEGCVPGGTLCRLARRDLSTSVYISSLSARLELAHAPLPRHMIDALFRHGAIDCTNTPYLHLCLFSQNIYLHSLRHAGPQVSFIVSFFVVEAQTQMSTALGFAVLEIPDDVRLDEGVAELSADLTSPDGKPLEDVVCVVDLKVISCIQGSLCSHASSFHVKATGSIDYGHSYLDW